MSEQELSDVEYLLELAQALDDAERVGLLKDRPEGVRYVQISDTLAGRIAARLREIATRKGGEAEGAEEGEG